MPPKKQSPKEVRKRDGQIIPFDQGRITGAIVKAMEAAQEGDTTKDPLKVSDLVVEALLKNYKKEHILTVEEVQDEVERQLVEAGFPAVVKAYILYRQERAKVRETKKEIPAHVQKLASESKKYFRNPLSEFIFYRSYSRWIEEENRRETWIETVDRYMNFMKENLGSSLSTKEYSELREAILKQEVMPSMRLLWAAGPAARATNVCAFNCSFVAPNKLRDFAEIMYVLMCGTGVGFSVESQTTQQLPLIKRQTGEKLPAHIIEDSKEGWGDALTLGLETWFSGKDISFNYDKIRPAGARLRTMGGRSSGPEPMRALVDFTRRKVLARQGKRLTNLDVHDIVCKIGEVVVAGGVRRSALISLSDLDDQEMRQAKFGQFYFTEPQRSMANNSAVYNEKPSTTEFMEEWLSLAKSGAGERGIFNRGSLKSQLPSRRWKVFEEDAGTSGTNPCGEIILKSKEFCNLSEVVARSEDNETTLMKKVRLASILGTYQSTLTHFPYLSRDWAKNCNEERLLGVSITGQWDCPAVRNPKIMAKLKQEAVAMNKKYAAKMGIAPSVAVTCVKPSGTVSQLVDASSGIHPRHSKYYIRRVRINATDPLFQMLKEQKFPYYPEVGQRMENATTYVLEFPMAAPKNAVLRKDATAIDQLEYWRMVKENFTEHNPSVTISVGDDEWIKVSNWVYENWDMVGGLSFLPKEDHVYLLAPYEEITEEKYKEMMSKLPQTDFSHIIAYEKEDTTQGAKELACVGGVCEIDSLPTQASSVSN